MQIPRKRFVSKRVIICQVISFLFIILIIWLDEILDMPNLFFWGTSNTNKLERGIIRNRHHLHFRNGNNLYNLETVSKYEIP